MDSKDIKVFGKIVEHCQSIIDITRNITDADQFKENNTESKAAMFDLMQIGELVQNGLSREAILQLTSIPWEQIYAMRNRIVHGYASVDYVIIWDTIQYDIPDLLSEIKQYI